MIPFELPTVNHSTSDVKTDDVNATIANYRGDQQHIYEKTVTNKNAPQI
jgi:hypothetical protein